MQKMFRVKHQNKIISPKLNSYSEGRSAAMAASKRFPNQELVIEKKVITESGFDLGWDQVGSVRCYW